MPLANEVWKPVVGNPRYFVSSHGRILRPERRVRNNAGFAILRRRFIKGNLSPHGYVRVHLLPQKMRYVHQIVAEAFIGERPERLTVNHKNFDTLDNAVSNLEYLSIGDNVRHAGKYGKMRHGEKHPNAKLSRDRIESIRKDASRKSAKELAKENRVSPATIHDIIHNRTWRNYACE